MLNELTVNSITVEEESSSSFIKGVSFGTLAPGTSCAKTLYLTSTGGAGDRVLDISVQSRSQQGTDEDPSTEDLTEILQTLVVPTVSAFNVTHDVVYRRSVRDRAGHADLRAFEEDFWDDGYGGEANVNLTLECAGPWNIELENVILERQVWA